MLITKPTPIPIEQRQLDLTVDEKRPFMEGKTKPGISEICDINKIPLSRNKFKLSSCNLHTVSIEN